MMGQRLFAFFPERASTVAGSVDALYVFLVSVSAFFAILIAVLVVGFAVRYRRRSDDEVPQPIHGSLVLEIVWTVIPLGLAMVMFFWGASLYFHLSRPPADAEEVLAVGKQWMWKFQHREGHREINQLHVPVGRPIKLTMSSEDVIHSFFVPAFRVKADVLPGRYTTAWFEATKPGQYHLFCAEFCGTEHSRMIGQIVVMEPAKYEAWLAGGAAAAVAPEAAGEKLFGSLGCVTCHTGDTPRGPSLAGVVGREVKLATGETVVADADYIRESILTPQAKMVAGFQPLMPTFQGQLSEEQLLQVIAYLKTLE